MSFREDLLRIMEAKHHWAWAHFSGPGASRAQLRIHYEQEFLTYVRDFPQLLGRIHGRCPVPEVRRLLAENLYEEETGGLSGTGPHPDLFLRMMEGLRFPRSAFGRARLLPPSRAYRRWLDEATTGHPWIVGAAVLTLFVEGSVHERREIESASPADGARVFDPSQEMLVRHHGVAPEALDLKRAHALVEQGHRRAAWEIVETHARSRAERARVGRALSRSLRFWLAYRDGVARAARVVRPARIR
jgi:pyrroloquinoline-quinone synthase